NKENISNRDMKESPGREGKKGGEGDQPLQPVRKFHGKYVQLTEDEYATLQTRYGAVMLEAYIEAVNDYCSNFKTGGYKDYAAAIRSFARHDAVKPPTK